MPQNQTNAFLEVKTYNLSQLCYPCFDACEAVHVCDIKDQQCCISSPIIDWPKGMEPLLPCCVPKTQVHLQAMLAYFSGRSVWHLLKVEISKDHVKIPLQYSRDEAIGCLRMQPPADILYLTRQLVDNECGETLAPLT